MKEILIKARELLAKGWCQRWYAKDINGNNMPFNDPSIVCYCISGAISTVLDGKVHNDIYIYVTNKTGCESIVTYNDAPDRTQADVLDLIDNCIKELECVG